ncbi:hypothetical protein TNCV_4604251 [Trichonephila clavipes]|nr:hypothetical protein TNCV_4604251 [Trichonephila clavipes]
MKQCVVCSRGFRREFTLARVGGLSFGEDHSSRRQRPPAELLPICSDVEAIIFAPDEGGVKTSRKSAGGTDAGKAIGCAGAQMLVKLLELEKLLELDHVSTLVSLSVSSRDSRASF